jgi:Family of unknown function (DUF6152)
MRTRLAFLAAGVSLVLAPVPALAHHAFAAEFDGNAPVKLRGTITKVELINPHAWIHMDVKKPDGTVEQWMIEGGTPNALIRRGFNRDTLKVGLEIVVEGFQAKDHSNRANGRDVTFSDGKKLFVGSSGNGAPDDATHPDK